LQNKAYKSIWVFSFNIKFRKSAVSIWYYFTGTEVVGRGMVSGAEKTSEYLSYGSDYVKQYITPEETAKEVDPKLKQRLETARYGSLNHQ
jgi:hypothetical protein